MWKLIPTLTCRLLRYNATIYTARQVRTFLSDSFSLDQAWDKRLLTPIIQKVKLNDLFYELDNQFQQFANANAIDIDLFANAVTDSSHLDEVEDVVHKLRLSPEAINILPSTHHAFIRIFMKFGDVNELLRILNDRLNYGIFPDDFCSMYMMDTFIKNDNFKNAAKVGVLHMLQEDFKNPIIKYMTLYSCTKFLENPVPWYPEQEKEEIPEDDGEVIKVRVDYIRNPFFDDHFDLTDPYHLIGKTFWMIGKEMPDYIGKSYQLLGYVLHNKFDKAKDFIEKLLSSPEKPLVTKDSLKLCYDALERVPKSEGEEGSKLELSKEEVRGLLNKVENSGLLSEDSLLIVIENRLRQVITEREKMEIEKQTKLYDEWIKNREELYKQYMEKLEREKRLAEVENKKRELAAKEEELFFFEKEDKYDIIIQEREERKIMSAYKGKKKKPKKQDDDYIPPEVQKKFN